MLELTKNDIGGCDTVSCTVYEYDVTINAVLKIKNEIFGLLKSMGHIAKYKSFAVSFLISVVRC